MVAQSSHDRHMTLEGFHIPKTMGVQSDQASGHNFRCDWQRPMGPGQVLLEPIGIAYGVIRGDEGLNWRRQGRDD